MLKGCGLLAQDSDSKTVIQSDLKGEELVRELHNDAQFFVQRIRSDVLDVGASR